jgi:hypothetical protein
VQIEARTRQDIEDKKQQLRLAVGDSYRLAKNGLFATNQRSLLLTSLGKVLLLLIPSSCRDLISSADTIVNIARQSDNVVQSLDSLEERLQKLSVAAAAGKPSGPDEAASTSYDRLYGETSLS